MSAIGKQGEELQKWKLYCKVVLYFTIQFPFMEEVYKIRGVKTLRVNIFKLLPTSSEDSRLNLLQPHAIHFTDCLIPWLNMYLLSTILEFIL